jgi:hypothetical protein
MLHFVPGLLFKLLGTSLGAGGSFTASEYGAAMVGYDAIGRVVTLLSVISGVLNPLGWCLLLVCLFFTLGSAYLLLAR